MLALLFIVPLAIVMAISLFFDFNKVRTKSKSNFQTQCDIYDLHSCLEVTNTRLNALESKINNVWEQNERLTTKLSEVYNELYCIEHKIFINRAEVSLTKKKTKEEKLAEKRDKVRRDRAIAALLKPTPPEPGRGGPLNQQLNLGRSIKEINEEYAAKKRKAK